jgi:hypothetical protein
MQTSPRYDIYAFIHKGLRAFMAHTLLRVGELDPLDPDEVADVTQGVAALLDICCKHMRHENDVVHAAMEARRPGSAGTMAEEHVQHERDIAALRQLLARVPGNAPAAQDLYRALSVFVAHNLVHMHREETQHNQVLWETHSDDEIYALEHRIVASQAPEDARLALRWMLPHMNPAERAVMLQGMRAAAPPAVFQDVLGLVRPLLGGRGWHKLSAALAL